MPPVIPEPQPSDGRRQRTVRTRAAIVAALMALVDEGDPAPTAAQVAERAGVALRSIGQHFASREELFAAAAAVYARRAETERVEIDAAAPRGQRVAAFAAARARALEASAGLRRAVAMLEARSEVVAEGARRQAGRRRGQVEQAFGAELDACTRTARKALLDALDLLAGGKVWDVMRQDQGLSRAMAERRLRALIDAVLDRPPAG